VSYIVVIFLCSFILESPSSNSSKQSLQDIVATSLRDPRVVDWCKVMFAFIIEFSIITDTKKIILQGVTILVFPLVSHLPSGVVFFWTVNSVGYIFLL
jgi:hypothetical protein